MQKGKAAAGRGAGSRLERELLFFGGSDHDQAGPLVCSSCSVGKPCGHLHQGGRVFLVLWFGQDSGGGERGGVERACLSDGWGSEWWW